MTELASILSSWYIRIVIDSSSVINNKEAETRIFKKVWAQPENPTTFASVSEPASVTLPQVWDLIQIVIWDLVQIVIWDRVQIVIWDLFQIVSSARCCHRQSSVNTLITLCSSLEFMVDGCAISSSLSSGSFAALTTSSNNLLPDNSCARHPSPSKIMLSCPRIISPPSSSVAGIAPGLGMLHLA